MIKELKNITDREYNSLKDSTLVLTEKIDAPYFIINIKNGISQIYKSNHKLLEKEDIILNNMYKHIENFVKKGIDVINLPDCEFGMWYFPSAKPRNIYYKKYAGKFMLSNINHGDETYIKNALREMNVLDIPVICELNADEKFMNSLEKLRNGLYTETFFILNLLKNVKYKGTDFDEMEGIIFRNEKSIYQTIIFNGEEKIENTTQRKMYRDVILKDFIQWYKKNEPYIEENSDYVGKVCGLFIKYINATDVINRYSIEREDLLPPFNGYKGDMCYDEIGNQNVELICRNNYILKGIFGILLNSLKKPLVKYDGDLLINSDIENFKKIQKEIREA